MASDGSVLFKKILKAVIIEFVYDCLSGMTKNRQSTDDTVQER